MYTNNAVYFRADTENLNIIYNNLIHIPIKLLIRFFVLYLSLALEQKISGKIFENKYVDNSFHSTINS